MSRRRTRPCLPPQGERPRAVTPSISAQSCAATASITRTAMARFDGPRDAGLLAVDMETSGLYADAAALGVQALSICTVVDSAATGTQIDPSERQAVFGPMAALALDVAAATG